MIMKELLSLIALFGVIAITDIALSPNASATVLNTGIHALNAEQAGVAEKTAVRCRWRNGRRHCTSWHRQRCWWRHGRRICRW
jgi:hypothetical protein